MALDAKAIAKDGASILIWVVTDRPAFLTMTLFSVVPGAAGWSIRALVCT